MGRPGTFQKGQSMTDILSWALDQRKTITNKNGEKKDFLIRQMMAEILIGKAMKGDIQAIKYIYDRIDGSPIQSVKSELSGGIDISALTSEENDIRIKELGYE